MFAFCELRAFLFAFRELEWSRTAIDNWQAAGMRVISKSRLKQFWQSPNCGDSAGPLLAWHTHVSDKSAAWRNWSDVKSVFGNADLVGKCVVFNIGGNKYRLITRILYASQKVFVLKVMTHREYDQEKWKEDCGCFAPPPKTPKKKTAATVPAKRKGKRR